MEKIEKTTFDDVVKKLPEARSSVTYSVSSQDGFPALVTLRSNDEAELFALMKDTEKYLLDNGYTPDNRRGSYGGGGSTRKPQEIVGTCPKCSSPTVKFTTKTGKTGVQCSTRKYDFTTKVTTGCDYIAWDEVDEPANEAQKRVLTNMGLWTDGLTKAQAAKLIVENNM